jgi:dolichol kinase
LISGAIGVSIWTNIFANSHNLLFFPAFVFLPLTIGDALGEIIGTIWGKQKLRVWGIGQINRKSLLGTMAVFLGSLLPLMFIVVSASLSLKWWVLCFCVAITTTVIELIAPRSTDNFFIPVGNALVCLIFVNCFAGI